MSGLPSLFSFSADIDTHATPALSASLSLPSSSENAYASFAAA